VAHILRTLASTVEIHSSSRFVETILHRQEKKRSVSGKLYEDKIVCFDMIMGCLAFIMVTGSPLADNIACYPDNSDPYVNDACLDYSMHKDMRFAV